LIGVYYFYKKASKQKYELLQAYDHLKVKGTLPKRVGGTRWLSHMARGIKNIKKSFKGTEAQLGNASHTNSKAEGFYKLLTDKTVVCTMLLLEVSDTFIGH